MSKMMKKAEKKTVEERRRLAEYEGLAVVFAATRFLWQDEAEGAEAAADHIAAGSGHVFWDECLPAYLDEAR